MTWHTTKEAAAYLRICHARGPAKPSQLGKVDTPPPLSEILRDIAYASSRGVAWRRMLSGSRGVSEGVRKGVGV